MVYAYPRLPGRSALNVSLSPELDRFVHDRVASGRYQTASEVVRDGLRLLAQQERDYDAAFESLKAKLARGSAQADRGEFVDPATMLATIEGLKRRRAGKGVPATGQP